LKGDSIKLGKAIGDLLRIALLQDKSPKIHSGDDRTNQNLPYENINQKSNPPLLKMGVLNEQDIIKGISESLEQTPLNFQMDKNPLKYSTHFKEKVINVVSDLQKISEDNVDTTINDTSRMINALMQIFAESDIIENHDQQEHLKNSFHQISMNIHQLAQNEEMFIANVIMNEDQLRADTLKMQQAWEQNDSVELGKVLGDMLRLTLLNFDDNVQEADRDSSSNTNTPPNEKEFSYMNFESDDETEDV